MTAMQCNVVTECCRAALMLMFFQLTVTMRILNTYECTLVYTTKPHMTRIKYPPENTIHVYTLDTQHQTRLVFRLQLFEKFF